MAFRTSYLKPVYSLGEGPLWSYKSADALEDVTVAGYFNAIAGNLSVGDRILVTSVTGLNSDAEAFAEASDYVVDAVSPDVTLTEGAAYA